MPDCRCNHPPYFATPIIRWSYRPGQQNALDKQEQVIIPEHDESIRDDIGNTEVQGWKPYIGRDVFKYQNRLEVESVIKRIKMPDPWECIPRNQPDRPPLRQSPKTAPVSPSRLHRCQNSYRYPRSTAFSLSSL